MTERALSERRFLRKGAVALSVLATSLQLRSLHFAKLYWLARRSAARVPGTFRFSFGPVRYTDASSLLTMYSEIFVDRMLETQLPDAPRILDCGANIGLATIWFKMRYPQASVTLFEPDPELVRVLIENLETLALNDAEIVPSAVSGISGAVPFARATPMSGRIATGSSLTVESVRLSDWIQQPVDLLKLDIEGSEFDVIENLCASGKIDRVGRIICEIHDNSRLQARLATLLRSLDEAGFRSTLSELRPWQHGPGPPDPTPFPGVPTGKFLAQLYAWRDGQSP